MLGETGCPAEVDGGAVLTYTVAEPDVVPPVGQDVFPTAVTVYVCEPVAVGVTFTLYGLLGAEPVYGPPLPVIVYDHGPVLVNAN